MAITTVLFDLDGTLLPMDQDVFVKRYLGLLAEYMAPHGYDPHELVKAIWSGTGAMVMNDGKNANETVFWNVFASVFGEKSLSDMPLFDEFYRTRFDLVKDSCGFDARADKAVKAIKSMGYRTVLATNPIFPSVATEARIRWAGLDSSDFDLITTYENSSYSKPSLGYYKAIMEKLGVKGEECLMVGNDVSDDMVVDELGMKVFLMTDHLINKSGRNIALYPKGSFDELVRFIGSLT